MLLCCKQSNLRPQNQRKLLTPSFIFLSLFFTCVEVNADDNQQTLQFTAYESCPYVCSLKKKPFRESHTDSNNRHKTEKGFLVDIVEAIFNQASINVNVDILPTARALKLAREGKADGIIGVSKRQAPSLSFPNVNIGQRRLIFYVNHDDDWHYAGLNSMASRRLAVQFGVSYGIADNYIQHYQNTHRIQKITGGNINERLLMLLAKQRANLIIQDKNIMEHYLAFHANAKLSDLTASKNHRPVTEAGYILPENIYLAFNHPHARQYIDLVSKGLDKLRKRGELDRILMRYGLTDWQQWQTDRVDPFAANESGSYLQRLKADSQAYSALNQREPRPNKNNLNRTINMNFESSVTTDSGYWHYAKKFKQLVEEASNNQLRVSLNFGNRSEHDIVMKMSEGQLQMGMVATNNVAPYAPSLGALALPYMFPSVNSAQRLFTHAMMNTIAERTALESGVRPLSFYIGGYRLLANNRLPVLTTDDLANLKIRVPSNQLMVETFRAWGLDPYPVSWPQLFPALENNIINGMENPINILMAGVNQTKPVWETLRYVTELNYFLFTAPHLISEKFLTSLSQEHRKIIETAAKQAQVYSWQLTEKQESELKMLAKKNGMLFTLPDNENSDWRAKAKAIWPRLYFRAGGKDYVEGVAAILGTYENTR